MALTPAPVRANTIAVNTTADVTANDGQCTLREAITAANSNMASGALAGECVAGAAGLDTIGFNIPATDPHCDPITNICSMTRTSALPAITEAVTLNGYTQPGASENTNALNAGINAVVLIELSGMDGDGIGGLQVNASNSVIRGLNIHGAGDEITLGDAGGPISANNVTIAGNFLGTNPAGTAQGCCGGFGIRQASGDNNTFGGPAAADRNLISGNKQGGIFLQSGSGNGNLIQGNYIGTDISGTFALNTSGGLGIGGQPTANTMILGNLISGNDSGGVEISVNFNTLNSGVVIQGNLIGTQRDGISPLGNNFGIRPGVNGNLVGGTSPGQGNIIAFNQIGVIVASGGVNNAILGNSIFKNGFKGITLTNGSTPLANNSCDTAVFGNPGNKGQNYPVITAADVVGGNVSISGTLDSTPSTTLRLEFFANQTCDANIAGASSGTNGEGQTYLGFADVTTDPSCNASFGPLVFAVPPGQSIFTATATDPAKNTSEFSACFPVGVPSTPGGPTPTPTITPTPSGLEICDNCIDDDGDTSVDRDDNECSPRADGGDTGLGDPKRRGKAVNKCGKVLAKSAQKLAATKLKLLQACTRLAFTCVQQKPADAGCPLKAQKGCGKGLAKLGAARAKVAAAVRATCGEPKLSFADLTGDTGLGFAREAGVCALRGVAALTSVDDVVACVTAIQECRAEAMLGYEQPRATELLVLAGRTVAIDAPCLGTGADGSGGGLTAPTGKRVAKCAQALAKAGAKFASGEVKLVQACTTAVGKCVQEKPADAKCLPKARRGCGKQLAKLSAPVKGLAAKLAAAVAKSCGAAGLATSTLIDATGLGFGALAADCATLGVPALDGVASIAECLERQHACRVEQMLESRIPRLHELLELGQVTLP